MNTNDLPRRPRWTSFLLATVTIGLGLPGNIVAADPPMEAANAPYELTLKLTRHVVKVGDLVTFETTLRSRREFAIVSSEFQTQRMAFFHRGTGRVVFVDNEPIDRVPTEKFDQLGPTFGGLLLTPVGASTYKHATDARTKSPGIFIMRAKWELRERQKDGRLSQHTVQVTSNWVLADVRATDEWRSSRGPPEDINSLGSLDEQEALERIYTGKEE